MKHQALQSPDWLIRNAVYQINPRTFSPQGTLKAVIEELPYLKSMGFHIIYLCPFFEEDPSTDRANWSVRQKKSETENPKNPYRMNDYFAVDEEYGTMQDLAALIQKAHSLDMKILLDVVYAHIGPNAPIIQRHPEFVQQNPDGTFICTKWNFPKFDYRCEGLREYLYCNMVYYIAVLDVDGFRCDVGDLVPVDFWKEARRRMKAVKADSVLINEGKNYDSLTIAFDSSYCFAWHELLRKVYCEGESAKELKIFSEELTALMPDGAHILRDMENHDTVTDWDGRTEKIIGHRGMEQILAFNYLLDGIPMIYCGNELACTAHLSMFANRFYPGKFEVTDRSKKNTPEALERQEFIQKMNRMTQESDLLAYGKTQWIDSDHENITIFKRILGDEELIFIGNTGNREITHTASFLSEYQNRIFGGGILEGETLTLAPYDYFVAVK